MVERYFQGRLRTKSKKYPYRFNDSGECTTLKETDFYLNSLCFPNGYIWGLCPATSRLYRISLENGETRSYYYREWANTSFNLLDGRAVIETSCEIYMLNDSLERDRVIFSLKEGSSRENILTRKPSGFIYIMTAWTL